MANYCNVSHLTSIQQTEDQTDVKKMKQQEKIVPVQAWQSITKERSQASAEVFGSQTSDNQNDLQSNKKLNVFVNLSNYFLASKTGARL